MSFTTGARLVRVPHPALRHGTRASPTPRPPSFSFYVRGAPTVSWTRQQQTHASPTSTPSKTSLNPHEPPPPPSPSDLLNPPATTRPPPLELPTRDRDTALPTYLFRLGRAYTGFYKASLGQLWRNHKAVRALRAPTAVPSPSPSPAPAATHHPQVSRATLHLRARNAHDMRRLPVFGVLVLVCGEFTPLIVLAFPRVTPYVSRIPAQVTQLRKQVEARRARLAPPPQDSPQPENAAAAHIARTLDLVSRLWDRLGFVSVPPGAVRRARDAVRFLAVDDALLADAVEDQNKKPALDWRKGGPADFLVDEEVVLACEARGMDVLDVDVATLRRKLDAWVRHTTRGGDRWGAAAFEETQGRVRALLLGREQLKV